MQAATPWLPAAQWAPSGDADVPPPLETYHAQDQEHQVSRTVEKRHQKRRKTIDSLVGSVIQFTANEAAQIQSLSGRTRRGEAARSQAADSEPPENVAHRTQTAQGKKRQSRSTTATAEEQAPPAASGNAADASHVLKSRKMKNAHCRPCKDGGASQDARRTANISTDTLPSASPPAPTAGCATAAPAAGRPSTATPKQPIHTPKQHDAGQKSQAAQQADEAAPSAEQQQPSKFLNHLKGGRFRQINETLYSCSGERAFKLMQEDPAIYESYHEGFESQVKKWPANPVQLAIKWLRRLPAGSVVADFGCGFASIAASLGKTHTVHSFDLVAANEHVTACNMANVPCTSGTVDAAVFCLALMGTDYPAFLAEAARVLKPGGTLWIAEIRSRFVPEGGKEEDTDTFARCLGGFGFKRVKEDKGNQMFIVWKFRKVREGGQSKAGPLEWPVLRACKYKLR